MISPMKISKGHTTLNAAVDATTSNTRLIIRASQDNSDQRPIKCHCEQSQLSLCCNSLSRLNFCPPQSVRHELTIAYELHHCVKRAEPVRKVTNPKNKR